MLATGCLSLHFCPASRILRGLNFTGNEAVDTTHQKIHRWEKRVPVPTLTPIGLQITQQTPVPNMHQTLIADRDILPIPTRKQSNLLPRTTHQKSYPRLAKAAALGGPLFSLLHPAPTDTRRRSSAALPPLLVPALPPVPRRPPPLDPALASVALPIGIVRPLSVPRERLGVPRRLVELSWTLLCLEWV